MSLEKTNDLSALFMFNLEIFNAILFFNILSHF